MESKLLVRLNVLSHPRRMAIFRLLVRRYPDSLAAGDIAQIIKVKANTASVYLSALHQCGLVLQERRGKSILYQLNLETAQAVVADLFQDCCRGRADICPPLGNANTSYIMSEKKFNILFICTGNSARSILAEAITRHVASAKFNVYSAGTRPASELNPIAIEMLKSRNIDCSELRAKNISEFQGPGAPVFDFVFTVCDLAANEECPAWSGQPVSGHWGLPDPVKAVGTEAEKRLAFQNTYGRIYNRIQAFSALPFKSLDRVSLQKKIDEIGADAPRD